MLKIFANQFEKYLAYVCLNVFILQCVEPIFLFLLFFNIHLGLNVNIVKNPQILQYCFICFFPLFKIVSLKDLSDNL